MATKTSKNTPIPMSTAESFLLEDAQDTKVLRIGLVVAVIFHLIILAIHFPKMNVTTKSVAQKKKIYVVQQVRFKKPPPRQEEEIPKPKSKKVPIPDPTPDEPEPIRLDEEEEPDLDIPDTDMIFDIPGGPPPVAPQGPIMVAGDVKKPVKISGASPVYTEVARKARIEGTVIVQAIIDKSGTVKNVEILKGLPMGLDKSAMNAVKGWRFEPATLNGKPVDVYYNLTVNFKLN